MPPKIVLIFGGIFFIQNQFIYTNIPTTLPSELTDSIFTL